MWFVLIGLTIFFWLLLDNILVGAILAVFSLFLFTMTRALFKVRQQQKMEKASLQQSANSAHSDNQANPQVNEQGNVLHSEQISHQLETAEIDDSYLRLVEEASSTSNTASTKHNN